LYQVTGETSAGDLTMMFIETLEGQLFLTIIASAFIASSLDLMGIKKKGPSIAILVYSASLLALRLWTG